MRMWMEEAPLMLLLSHTMRLLGFTHRERDAKPQPRTRGDWPRMRRRASHAIRVHAWADHALGIEMWSLHLINDHILSRLWSLVLSMAMIYSQDQRDSASWQNPLPSAAGAALLSHYSYHLRYHTTRNERGHAGGPGGGSPREASRREIRAPTSHPSAVRWYSQGSKPCLDCDEPTSHVIVKPKSPKVADFGLSFWGLLNRTSEWNPKHTPYFGTVSVHVLFSLCFQ